MITSFTTNTFCSCNIRYNLRTVVKRQNDVKKKDGYGGEHLKKFDESYKSMNSVTGAYILTNLKLILNISASTKMIKRNEYHGKSKKRR